MRYYVVSQDKEYGKAPRLVNWFGTIKVEDIRPGSYDALKEEYVLQMETKDNTEYADFLTEPFCMVSNMVKYVLQKYEPCLKFTDLYLFDKKNKITFEYYIPQIKEFTCLTKRSVTAFQGTQLTYGELDLSQLGDHSIFYLAEMKKKHIVIRSDLAESLLRRGFYGVTFQKLDTINEEVWMEEL